MMDSCYTMATWKGQKPNFSLLTTIFITLHGHVG